MQFLVVDKTQSPQNVLDMPFEIPVNEKILVIMIKKSVWSSTAFKLFWMQRKSL